MRNAFDIGKLSSFFSKPWAVLLLLAQFVVLVAFAADYHGRNTSEGCLFCHADKAKMEREGYPQFYVTQAQAEKETRMPGATCLDCHLGDGRSHDKDEGHKGMLKLLVIDNDARVIPRKGVIDSLMPSGSDRLYSLFPKAPDGSPSPDVFTILWHDRDRSTLGYDPGIAKKTCGIKGCHPQEVEQFSHTDMGGNVRQRGSRFWTDSHGPNNCGPSFADLPPDSGAAAGYSERNYKVIKDNLSCPSNYGNATDRQRFCNVCHTGCLDCHYNPNRKEGVHNFTMRIPSATCTGGGRGTGMCHSGSQERRRGDSYLGKEFSQPPGMPEDAHVKEGMECMDCHETGEKGMGDMTRAVDCSGCHYSASRALASGVHRRLRCQACHVSVLGGYEMTVWGRGHVAGQVTPFKKYSLYYGLFGSPILIKDMDGMYTPYKIWPNMATNIKGTSKEIDGIRFRWPKGETKDAYAFLGTHGGLPGANNALCWLQLESVGHATGPSRTCGSCHDATAQKSHATWEYLGYAGSAPFKGEQDIIADKRGLRVEKIRKLSDMELIDDAKPWDFAAWLYLGNIWKTGGDFSIPRSDAGKYAAYVRDEKAFKEKLKAAEARLGGLDKKSPEYRELQGRIKKARDIGFHDPESGIVFTK
ncbi:MAG: cytochrome c3 family protein [Nitrospirota bacterium]